MATPKLVVKEHQPMRLGVIWGVALVLAVGTAYLMYEYGRYRGGYDSREANTTEAELRRELEEFEQSNSKLREEIALLETSDKIDEEAYEKVESMLGDLQAEVQNQKQELAFYRSIIAPEDGKRGLHIQEFRLTPAGSESEFRMRLVLVQAANKHDRRVSGTVTMSIEGARDGAQTSYNIADLINGEDSEDNLGFSFRYFQNFERQLVLPTGFVPQRINVEVSPKGRVADNIKQSFDWSVKSS
ncbi:MAG: DUF6776 family protein [Gammaproteobacteria bacterium]